MDRAVSGFRARFWKVLDDVIETEKSQVFTYAPGFGSSAGTLWSTNFFFFNKNLKKIVFFLVSATSKLAFVSQEEGEGSDVEMEGGGMEDESVEDDVDEATPKKSGPPSGYVDFDLIDMDDLGLEAIDIPPPWISADFSSSSTLSSSSSVRDVDEDSEISTSFESKSGPSRSKLSTPSSSSSAYSRSLFSSPGPSGVDSFTAGSPFFVEPSPSRGGDLSSLFSSTRG
jgi:hypothetical protein